MAIGISLDNRPDPSIWRGSAHPRQVMPKGVKVDSSNNRTWHQAIKSIEQHKWTETGGEVAANEGRTGMEV